VRRPAHRRRPPEIRKRRDRHNLNRT
jgi:hypothetical protein